MPELLCHALTHFVYQKSPKVNLLLDPCKVLFVQDQGLQPDTLMFSTSSEIILKCWSLSKKAAFVIRLLQCSGLNIYYFVFLVTKLTFAFFCLTLDSLFLFLPKCWCVCFSWIWEISRWKLFDIHFFKVPIFFLKPLKMFNILFFSFSQSNGHISLGGGDHYQERLSRIESDKESLVLQVPTRRCCHTITRSSEKQIFYCTEIKRQWTLSFLQVSVLTDQVEAQGEKIRDLDLCLDDHREKLNATEEMLQQVCLSWQVEVESSPPCVIRTLLVYQHIRCSSLMTSQDAQKKPFFFFF